MNKHFGLAIILCGLFIIVSLLASAGWHWKNLRYSGLAFTTDESTHLASGYYYLKTGRYFLNPEHPPLVKDLVALPLLLINPTLPAITSNPELEAGYAAEHYPPKTLTFSRELEVTNNQWDWTRVLLFNPQNNPDQLAFWARLMITCCNGIWLLVLYVLLAKISRPSLALIALGLLICSPFNLANGSLITMDFMVSILQMIAVTSCAIYLKQFNIQKDSKRWFMLTTFFITLALLTKFSSVLLLPVLLVGGGLYLWLQQGSWRVLGQYILRFALMGALIFCSVAIYYALHTYNMAPQEMSAQFDHYYPQGIPLGIKSLLTGLAAAGPLGKGLAQYISGNILTTLRINAINQPTFFMGKVYLAGGAGPMYFLVLYLTKLSLGFLAMHVLAFGLVIWKRALIKASLVPYTLTILLISFIVGYGTVALLANLQIGLRHIMPVIFAITILIAIIVDLFWSQQWQGIRLKYVFSSLFFAMVIVTIYAFPNYLSYYNVLAGGTAEGYQIATDSNFDWGQDAKQLVRWVDEHNVQDIYIDIEGNIPMQWYFDPVRRPQPPEDLVTSEPGSYAAIAISKYQMGGYQLSEDNFVEKIGTTILIFKQP